MLNCLEFHHIIYDTTASVHQQVPVLAKNDILVSRLIACCKLVSTFPWVYSLQFLFKSTYHSSRYKRKCEWVFFFLNTVYVYACM